VRDVFAGVDLGGTKIAAAIADADGTILAEDRTPTHSQEGPHAVLARVGALVSSLAGRIGARPCTLGMGVPGLVDVETGVTKFLPNMPTQWRGIPVTGGADGHL
jgi:glucokinase